MRKRRTLLKILGLVIAVVAVIAVLMAVIPYPPVQFKPSFPLSTDYEEAVSRFNSMAAETPSDVRDICRPFILTHDKKTPQVFVLLHGLTNCPNQFRKLAEDLHAQGHTVIVPLTPYHGKENRLTNALEKLTAEDLLVSADAAIAIAHGLGDKVTVAGLSVNGVTAGWYAQNTARVDRAVLISPFFGVHGISESLLPYVINFLARAPNHFFWWNPKLKAENPGPPYAYPRAATKPIAEILSLGEQVIREAQTTPPKTPDIVLIDSKTDMVLNRHALDKLVAAWKQTANLTYYQFPATDDVPHDMIDPNQPNQKVDTVYPILLKLLNDQPVSASP